MRNWNRSYPFYSADSTGWFSAYLWGIETTNWLRHYLIATAGFQHTYEELKLANSYSPLFNFSCFQHTYEELKQSSAFFHSSIPSDVFSIPMRNWNQCGRFWFRFRFRVFSIPMRNWNGHTQRECGAGHIRFQHTYEELKLEAASAMGRAFAGFQHTYEELKLRRSTTNSTLCPCFQHTYEELKHVQWIRNADTSEYVFSIPMRNWNSVWRSWTPAPVAVFSIPMRNWNTSYDGRTKYWRAVFSIPMRNWNITATQSNVRGHRGFQHTYEELKLKSLAPGFSAADCFQHTYEELKRITGCIPIRHHQRFQHTYEELKHEIFNLWMENLIGFSAYLWGIETFSSPWKWNHFP